MGEVFRARERADGKELYFVAPDSKMMAVTVAASGAATEGTAIPPITLIQHWNPGVKK